MLSIDWMKDLISEDGSLYCLVAFDQEEESNNILQTEYSAEAYDENLDICAQKAVNAAAEMYSIMYDAFREESDDFLKEIEKILFVLQRAICFADKWRATKINPEIDNT